VSQAPPLLAYSPSSALAHPLMPSAQILSQWIKLSRASRRSPKLALPPAAPFTHDRTQSTSPSPPSGLPRRAAPRPLLLRRPGPPEPHRRSTSARPCQSWPRRNPNLGEASPPICFRSSDLNQTVHSNSLTRRGTEWSEPSDLL
jgi:hypothetical protein